MQKRESVVVETGELETGESGNRVERQPHQLLYNCIRGTTKLSSAQHSSARGPSIKTHLTALLKMLITIINVIVVIVVVVAIAASVVAVAVAVVDVELVLSLLVLLIVKLRFCCKQQFHSRKLY